MRESCSLQGEKKPDNKCRRNDRRITISNQQWNCWFEQERSVETEPIRRRLWGAGFLHDEKVLLFWSLDREDPLEESTASHSSIPAWRIPWMEKHGGLQSSGSQTVGHNWSDLVHMQFASQLIFLMERAGCHLFNPVTKQHHESGTVWH